MADKVLPPLALARLHAAGALLESPEKHSIFSRHQVRLQEGETYAQAVLRTIRDMPGEQQRRLQELVDWVQDYGFDVVSSPNQVAPRVAARGPNSAGADVEEWVPDHDEDAVAVARASVEETYARDLMAHGG